MRSTKLNILYLHQYFTTPDFCGGVRSYEFARRFVKSGHNVELITSTAFFPVPRSHRFQLISKHDVDGIRVHAIHISYGNKMPFLRRVVSFILFMLISSLYVIKFKKTDLIFASSTPLTIGVPALFAKWKHQSPMVFEVRDLWPDVPIAMGIIKSRFVKKFLTWFEMYIYQHSHKIVALSTGMQEALRKKGIVSQKIVVVPNACDIAEFEVERSSPPDIFALRQAGRQKLCLYAGTFGYVNNLSYLLELAAEIKKENISITFVLIGSGAEKEKLQKMILKQDLGQQVIMINPVSKKELIGYIQSVDACVSFVKDIPELFNNSANKFFDALAAGKPIIINHGGWQADLIEKHQLGVVLNRQVKQSVSRLQKFFFERENDDFENSRITNFARENYSREVLYNRLYNFVLLPLTGRYNVK